MANRKRSRPAAAPQNEHKSNAQKIENDFRRAQLLPGDFIDSASTRKIEVPDILNDIWYQFGLQRELDIPPGRLQELDGLIEIVKSDALQFQTGDWTKDHARCLVEVVDQYRSAVAKKRWTEAKNYLVEARLRHEICLALDTLMQNRSSIQNWAAVRTGLQIARRARWGDPQQRLVMVQQFLKKLRQKCPQLGINGMIRAATKECNVSRSYIQEQRRLGRLIIPSKQQ